MKKFSLLIMVVGHSFGAEVLLEDGRFITFKVQGDNKRNVDRIQMILHSGGSEPPIPIWDQRAPVNSDPDLVLRLPSYIEEISSSFQDDEEITLLIRGVMSGGIFVSIDLEAGKFSRPMRYINFPRKHDCFEDDSKSWVLLDHDRLAYRSKGFAQRIFMVKDGGQLEEVSAADIEKEAKRQSIQAGSAEGGANYSKQQNLEHPESKDEVLNKKKGDDRDRLPWFIAGGLVTGIFFLIFKFLKGKL